MWAAILILFVPLSLIPAGIAVAIYRFFLRGYVQDSWIPYLPEISMQWFPELLRGLIVGACAIAGTHA